MADFDWREASIDVRGRYAVPEPLVISGARQWSTLVEALLGNPQAGESTDAPRTSERIASDLAAFDAFLDSTLAPDQDEVQDEVQEGPCRVFVSHQRQDVPYAERIAWLAHNHGFEYWLDVHDPVLAIANRAVLPPHVQSILIAAIIEMALLNCSHVISVQTAHAAASRWVPYEFGRAKRHALRSDQAGSWFDNGVHAVGAADYLQLGVCATSELAVDRWLASQIGAQCRPARLRAWTRATPSPLPN